MAQKELEDFAKANQVELSFVSHGLTRDDQGWAHFAFKVALKTPRGAHETDYRMGIGHAKKCKRGAKGAFKAPERFIRDFFPIGAVTVHMHENTFWKEGIPK